MQKSPDKPYLDKPKTHKTTKEQLIYGGGETLKEVDSKRSDNSKILLTE